MPIPSPPTDRNAVLVVEDEALVRASVVDWLEEDGFEVIEAPTADYALTVLQARDDIAVVFTDVTMPGALNGLDLARIARAMYPQMMIIVTSGALPSGFSGLAPDARYMRKPYRMADIVRLIQGAVQGAPGDQPPTT